MRAKPVISIVGALVVAVLATGCQTAAMHRQAVQDDSGDRLTVGKVQREIRVGMSRRGCRLDPRLTEYG